MPKITRVLQQIFGGSLAAPNNIEVFGSTANGTPVYSLDLTAIQSARYLLGWGQAIVNGGSPVMQDRNAIDYLLSKQLAYLFQDGLPEWNSGTPYYIDSFCKVGGVVYISKTDANIGNDPTTATNDWKTLTSVVAPSYDPRGLAKAWVNFDGTSTVPFVRSSLGISGVDRLGVGNYLINFDPVMSDAEYVYTGFCAQENAIAATIGLTRFPGDIRTPSQLQVRVCSNFDSSGFNSSEVCLSFFNSA